MSDETCCCGHVYDEHERGKACTIDDCPCIHFEADENDDA